MVIAVHQGKTALPLFTVIMVPVKQTAKGKRSVPLHRSVVGDLCISLGTKIFYGLTAVFLLWSCKG